MSTSSNTATVGTEPVPRVPRQPTGRYLRFAKGKYAQVYVGTTHPHSSSRGSAASSTTTPTATVVDTGRNKYFLAPYLRKDSGDPIEDDCSGWSDGDDDDTIEKKAWPPASLIAYSQRYRCLAVGTPSGVEIIRLDDPYVQNSFQIGNESRTNVPSQAIRILPAIRLKLEVDDQPVSHVTFSAGGRYLAVYQPAKSGIHIFSLANIFQNGIPLREHIRKFNFHGPGGTPKTSTVVSFSWTDIGAPQTRLVVLLDNGTVAVVSPQSDDVIAFNANCVGASFVKFDYNSSDVLIIGLKSTYTNARNPDSGRYRGAVLSCRIQGSTIPFDSANAGLMPIVLMHPRPHLLPSASGTPGQFYDNLIRTPHLIHHHDENTLLIVWRADKKVTGLTGNNLFEVPLQFVVYERKPGSRWRCGSKDIHMTELYVPLPSTPISSWLCSISVASVPGWDMMIVGCTEGLNAGIIVRHPTTGQWIVRDYETIDEMVQDVSFIPSTNDKGVCLGTVVCPVDILSTPVVPLDVVGKNAEKLLRYHSLDTLSWGTESLPYGPMVIMYGSNGSLGVSYPVDFSPTKLNPKFFCNKGDLLPLTVSAEEIKADSFEELDYDPVKYRSYYETAYGTSTSNNLSTRYRSMYVSRFKEMQVASPQKLGGLVRVHQNTIDSSSSSSTVATTSGSPSPLVGKKHGQRLFTESDDTSSSNASSSTANTTNTKVTKREDYLVWDDYFMAVAFLSAMRSKDPSTQVGACIVDPEQRIVGIGYNGFPRGCNDDDLPWARTADNELDTKYPYVCHAEMNAILNKNNENLKNCRIYVALFPCNECTKLIIQSGIKEVIFVSDKYHDSPPFIASRRLLELAGIKYRHYKPQQNDIHIKFIADE